MAVTNDQLIQLNTGINGEESKAALLKSFNSRLQQLSGTIEGDTTLGVMAGNVIPDNSTIKQALQALESRSDIGGGGTGKALSRVFLASTSNLATLQALEPSTTVDDFLFEWDTDGTASYTVIPLDKFIDSGAFTSVAFKGNIGSADQNILVFTAISGATAEVDLARFVDAAGNNTMTGAEIAAAYEALANTNKYTDAEKATVATVSGKEDAFGKNSAFNKNFGTAAGTVTQGNDARLSDARAPTAHTHPATDIIVDSTSFSGNLTAADNTSQKIADKLDALVVGGGGSTMTGAQIKTALDAEPDTEVMTTAERAKIAESASVDDVAQTAIALQDQISNLPASTMTGAEIKTALQAEPNTEVINTAERTKIGASTTAADLTASETTLRGEFQAPQKFKLLKVNDTALPSSTDSNMVLAFNDTDGFSLQVHNGTAWVKIGTDVGGTFSGGGGGGGSAAEVGATAHWLFGSDNAGLVDINGGNALTAHGSIVNGNGFATIPNGSNSGLMSAIADSAAMTFCMVARVAIATRSHLLASTMQSSNLSLGFMISNSGTSAQFRHAGINQQLIPNQVANDTWMFLATSFTGSTGVVVANDQDIQQTNNPKGVSALNIAIGNVNFGSNTFGFDVAEAIAFPTGLTPAEIEQVRQRSITRLADRNITLV